jgi:hypothetical protein
MHENTSQLLAQFKRHDTPNNRSKFWLYSRFAFVPQDLPPNNGRLKLTGGPINRNPLYCIRLTVETE